MRPTLEPARRVEMVVRELIGLLGIQTDQKSVEQGQASIGGLVKFVKGAMGAIASLMVIRWAKGAIDEVSAAARQVNRFSRMTGMAVEDVQKLGYVAELSGASFDDLSLGMRKMQLAQAMAADGSKGMVEIFSKLGVDIRDSSGQMKPASELMTELGDGFAKLGSDAERTRAATLLFGRGGTVLLPMFKKTTAEIKDMEKEFDDLGGVMSQDVVNAVSEDRRNFKALGKAIFGLKVTAAKTLLPAMNKIIDRVLAWWKANGALIRQGFGLVIGNVAGVLANIASLVADIVTGMTDWVKQLSPLEKKMGLIGGVIIGIGALIMKGPVGVLILVGVLVALLIDDFETWRKGGKSLTGDIVKGFKDLLGIDIVAWVKGAWDTLKGFLTWWKDEFVNRIGTLAAVVTLIKNVWDGPKKAFREFGQNMLEIWGADIDKFGAIGWGIIYKVKAVFDRTEAAADKFFAMLADKFIAPWMDPVMRFFNHLGTLIDGIVASVKAATTPDWLNGIIAKVQWLIDHLPLLGRGNKPEVGIPGGEVFPPFAFGRTPAYAPAAGAVSNTVNQTINAAPGMNEFTVAKLAAQAAGDEIDRRSRNAMKGATAGK
jgi:hypothetical protein